MVEAKSRFQRVEALFNQALLAPEAERAALIDAHCGGDAELAE